ncbi:family S53 protease [Peniophora sp. CONT]|nr:family S53 protease [Peniophora sp. CONT]
MVSARFSRLLVAICFVASAFGAVVPAFMLQEARSSAPATFTRISAAPSDQVLNMRINLAMNDRDGLEAKLMEAATPGSASFRQWLSKDDVESFSKPSAARETTKAVTDWLSSHSIEATPMTPAGDWLKIEVPVSKANELFNTEFSTFRHIATGDESVRTLEYSVPADLEGLIKVVHPTTSFFGPLRGEHIVRVSTSQLGERATAPASCDAEITPTCLQALYNMPDTAITDSKATLAVSAFVNTKEAENANIADMKTFLTQFRPDLDSSLTFNTILLDGATNSQDGNQTGGEANLDIQYTLGMANGIPTTFVDVGPDSKDNDDGGLDIIAALLAESNPPQVISTSYNSPENEHSRGLADALCDQYMALTSRGVTITFSTGDGGVAAVPGGSCVGEAFVPTSPACPFVTLVGATQNVSPEVGAALSAGGFSNYFGQAQAPWQANAVETYLKKLGSTNAGKFNASGRAYPDVSAMGENVQIIVNGQTQGVGGTSCSSPIFSSVLALINDQLLRAGKPVLGFANPFFYANPGAFNDITTGNNPGCGTDGFEATEGWDPVTGLGSPNYAALLEAALAEY